MLRITFSLISVLLLSGCASTIESFKEWTGYYSMNQNECMAANWYDIGYSDGRHDKPRSLIDKHRMSCSRFLITPDEPEYFEGFDIGYAEFLEVYCSPKNARKLGRAGNDYRDICPSDMRSEFLRHYDIGYQYYVEEYCEPSRGYDLGVNGHLYKDICPPHLRYQFVKAYRKGKKIRHLKKEYASLTDDIEYKERRLEFNSELMTKQERKRLKRELDDLRAERRQIKMVLNTAGIWDIAILRHGW